MEQLSMILGWVGIYAPVALGAIGSIVGCARAGQAACGAILEVESGHGKLVATSALPSSQTIYGIVVMYSLRRDVTLDTAPALSAIGLLVGLVLLISAMFQGACCASAISVSKGKPELFGLSVGPAAIVEGFAVFAFIFAMVLSRDFPGSSVP